MDEEKLLDALLEIGNLVATATIEAMEAGVFLPALGELAFLVSDAMAEAERLGRVRRVH